MTREDRRRGQEVKEDKGKGAETQVETEDKNSPEGIGEINKGLQATQVLGE